MRTVNNRYRHGTRVLYEDCSPTTSGWTAANPHDAHGPVTALGDLDATAMEDVVNILIAPPDAAGQAQVGSVAFGSPYGEKLVEAIGTVAIVIKRLVTSFLRSEMMGGLPTLASTDDYSWSPPAGPTHGH